MTTSIAENETLFEPEIIEEKPRTISELFDLSYSDMTDDEIDRLVAYKVEQASKQQLYKEQIEIAQQAMQTVISNNYEAAEYAKNKLDELTAHAIDRFKEASNEQTQ